jgi:uncharacterized protein GlcG (DUF336 family)
MISIPIALQHKDAVNAGYSPKINGKVILCAALAATMVLDLFLPNTADAEAAPTITTAYLAPELAHRIVATALSECGKRGYQVSVAVVSRDGNLLAFIRDPLSGPHTIVTSEKKAYSAATLRTKTSPMQARPDLNFAPGILLITGGVPILVGGKIYGGAAVAGAEPEVDEQCALAGIQAVQEVLEFSQ